MEKRCPDCCKTYTITYKSSGAVKGSRHKCGFAPCDTCEKIVDQDTHICYIQPVDDSEDAPATKKVPEDDMREDQTVLGIINAIVFVDKEPPLCICRLRIHQICRRCTNPDPLRL